jgi:type I restriction enzyme S subunit
MMLMRLDDSTFSAPFLMHVLNSPMTVKRVRDLTGGSASPHLNVAEIKGFPVPMPPISEQQEIARRVEALFKLADSIEKRVGQATARAERLTQAILSKAFSGELVPTEAELARQEGRDYEPASALLERIRRERMAAARSDGRTRPVHRVRRLSSARP